MERRVAYLERDLRRLRSEIDDLDGRIDRALTWLSAVDRSRGVPVIPEDDEPSTGNAQPCCGGVVIPDELTIVRQGAGALTLTRQPTQAKWSTGLIPWTVGLLYQRDQRNGRCLLNPQGGAVRVEISLQCQLNGSWLFSMYGSACDFTGQAFPSPYITNIPFLRVFESVILQTSVACQPFGFVQGNPGISIFADWWSMAQSFPWIVHE